jgi:hypothetical protein
LRHSDKQIGRLEGTGYRDKIIKGKKREPDRKYSQDRLPVPGA